MVLAGSWHILLTCLLPTISLPRMLTPGETGLKKLSRAVDGAVLSTHALMLDDVAPTLEQLAFLMGELRGASQLPAWKAVLSLDVSA